MSTCSSMIDFYLERYREGQADNAFHGLLELENACLPDLAKAFHSINDTSLRALLLNVIWQHREPSQIPLLAEALFDDKQEIWQEAIDGLVTFACSASLQALQDAKSRSFEDHREQRKFRKWLEEAISQTEAQMNA